MMMMCRGGWTYEEDTWDDATVLQLEADTDRATRKWMAHGVERNILQDMRDLRAGPVVLGVVGEHEAIEDVQALSDGLLAELRRVLLLEELAHDGRGIAQDARVQLVLARARDDDLDVAVFELRERASDAVVLVAIHGEGTRSPRQQRMGVMMGVMKRVGG